MVLHLYENRNYWRWKTCKKNKENSKKIITSFIYKPDAPKYYDIKI